jgi:hypothetical protein
MHNPIPQATQIELYNAVEFLRVIDRKAELAIRAHPEPKRTWSDEVDCDKLQGTQGIARMLAIHLQEKFSGVAPSVGDCVFDRIMGHANEDGVRYDPQHVEGLVVAVELARRWLYMALRSCADWEVRAAYVAVDHMSSYFHGFARCRNVEDIIDELFDESTYPAEVDDDEA